MIQNFFLPGFGTDQEFYKNFLSLVPGVKYLPNPEFTYSAVCGALENSTAPGEQINLLGWSLGALFALRYTLEHPGKINFLFLTGATARFCASGAYDNGIKEKTLHLMLKQLPLNPQVVMRNFYNTALAGMEEKEKQITRLLENMEPVENLQNGLQELLQTDLLGNLKKITVPVIIYQGAKDKITPLKGAQILQQGLPAAEIIIEPEGGHCLLFQYSEKIAAYCK